MADPTRTATRRGSVLIVDDEAEARAALAELLAAQGFAVVTAGDAFKALAKIGDDMPDVVVSDLRMPGMDGIELMHRLRAAPRPPAVVLVTGVADVPTVVRAMRQGAADYLLKPVDPDELVVVVGKQVAAQRQLAELATLRAQLAGRQRTHAMVGDSPAMRRLYAAIEQVAPSRATVLLTGESGTGKELVAAAIHAASPRAAGPLIRVHCAALAEHLLESELFGHEQGAFTGAIARREGRFAAADQGTLFLDEIGEVSPAVQVKLLRFLQERTFEPVGSNQPVRVDVRVIAATHRDLRALVAAGRFREDLFHRLNVVAIELPPLRERREDIPALARSFLERAAHDNDRALDGFADEALQALVAHPWPGNVRELAHAVERAAIMSPGPVIELASLPPTVRGRAEPDSDAVAVPGSSLRAIVRHAILTTLEATGGSTSKAAAILEITPRMIQYRLQEYRRAAKGMGPAVARGAKGAGPAPGGGASDDGEGEVDPPGVGDDHDVEHDHEPDADLADLDGRRLGA